MNKVVKRFCWLKHNLSKSKNLNIPQSTRNYQTVAKATIRNYSTTQVYFIDEENPEGTANLLNENQTNKYTFRNCNCGQLRKDNVNEEVSLCGWLKYQRMDKFLVLRDSYGEVQAVVQENDMEAQNLLKDLPYESIVEVKGKVCLRPEKMTNLKQKTGEIEILINKLTVINKARNNLPFNIREFQKPKEFLRMQYRYLDLRFPEMQRNLRVRSAILMKMRDYLANYCGFVDVETPTLFKATPGGAQEFVVPTRFPGQFYSLTQSPQQFKQMLMAGGIDRYFQIARCYRDEGARSDRQPEFTQLDIEMSFTDTDGVIALIEDLLNYSWPKFLSPVPDKFPRMNYQEAMDSYGSDKPDTTFDFKLNNCTTILKSNKNLVNCEDFAAYCLVFPKEYANLNKKIKEKLMDLSKIYPKVKLIQSKINTKEKWCQKVEKLLTNEVAVKLVRSINIPDDCVLFLGYGFKSETQNLMGKVRLEFVNYLEKEMGLRVRNEGMFPLWIVNFPLFEVSDETGSIKPAHHPFTAPNPADLELLQDAPLKVRALAYDLVINGYEIAGGSIRVHDPLLQEKLFSILGIEKSSMSHILEMLGSGCPPHGGIAIGLDRFLAVVLNAPSIRDVIAFPKTFEGRDPLSGAPSALSESVQKLYHIKSIVE